MKAQDLKELSKEDLIEKLKEQKDALGKLKINHKVAELENPINIRVVRKTVARIKTEITARSLQGENK